MKRRTLNKKKIIIGFIIVDLLLLILFKYYQPYCEPCLTDDCPPCLSEKQYFIIYISAVFNTIMIPYIVVKLVKSKKYNNIK